MKEVHFWQYAGSSTVFSPWFFFGFPKDPEERSWAVFACLFIGVCIGALFTEYERSRKKEVRSAQSRGRSRGEGERAGAYGRGDQGPDDVVVRKVEVSYGPILLGGRSIWPRKCHGPDH